MTRALPLLAVALAALAVAATAFLPYQVPRHDAAAVRAHIEHTIRLSRAAAPAADPLALTVDSLPTTSRHPGHSAPRMPEPAVVSLTPEQLAAGMDGGAGNGEDGMEVEMELEGEGEGEMEGGMEEDEEEEEEEAMPAGMEPADDDDHGHDHDGDDHHHDGDGDHHDEEDGDHHDDDGAHHHGDGDHDHDDDEKEETKEKEDSDKKDEEGEADKQCKTQTRFDRVITLASAFNTSEGAYELLDNDQLFLKLGLGLSDSEIATAREEALDFFTKQFGVSRSKVDFPTTFEEGDEPSNRMAFYSVVLSPRHYVVGDSAGAVPCPNTHALWGGFSAVGRNITLKGAFSADKPVHYPGVVNLYSFSIVFAPGTKHVRKLRFQGIRPLACDFTGCTVSAVTTTLEEGLVGDADGAIQFEPPMVQTRVMLTWPSRFV